MQLLEIKLALPILAVLVAMCGGCGKGGDRVRVPSFDPDGIASKAVHLHDANGDGMISGSEFDAAPSLAFAVRRLDHNGDGGLSADEIAGRVRQWQEYGSGLAAVECAVQLKHRPAAQVTVIYEPEEFMGDVVVAASGETGRRGDAVLSVPEEYRPNPGFLGVQPGFYRVKIRLPNGEELDARAGFEVAADMLNTHQVSL
jgi:hypothetical protein